MKEEERTEVGQNWFGWVRSFKLLSKELISVKYFIKNISCGMASLRLLQSPLVQTCCSGKAESSESVRERMYSTPQPEAAAIAPKENVYTLLLILLGTIETQ